MIAAVDTNVLLDVLSPIGAVHFDQARSALRKCLERGSLVISPIVYAELAPRFREQAHLDEFLSDSRIAMIEMPREGIFLAGALFAAYLRRGGKRERILPDYLVGAHALTVADFLLSRDSRFYGPTFPTLRAISPESLLTNESLL